MCKTRDLETLITCRARTVRPAGPMRLFVCLSVQGLGRPGNKLIVAAGTYGCFELAGLFASSLQKEAPEARECRWLTINKPRSEIHGTGVTVLCVP